MKEGHDAYLNCHADAFQSAFNTLNDRIQKFGKDSAEVAEWTRGQDTVFSNCSRGHHIPGPADKGMNKLIQYDRDYQVAAAHFYAGDFIQAGELFGKIAQERSSPWSGLANYLAARAFVERSHRKCRKPDCQYQGNGQGRGDTAINRERQNAGAISCARNGSFRLCKSHV